MVWSRRFWVAPRVPRTSDTYVDGGLDDVNSVGGIGLIGDADVGGVADLEGQGAARLGRGVGPIGADQLREPFHGAQIVLVVDALALVLVDGEVARRLVIAQVKRAVRCVGQLLTGFGEEVSIGGLDVGQVDQGLASCASLTTTPCWFFVVDTL